MTIDLHCHILPGIDDGADNLNDSLEMARYAVGQGITDILCTPHHNNGKYVNPRAEVEARVAHLQTALNQFGIPLQLHSGQEIRITDTLPDEIMNAKILGTDSQNLYLLIEFPRREVPFYSPFLFKKLLAMGKIPIIVHPERNNYFREQPDALREYLAMGCFAQLTAPSYVGKFGRSVKSVAQYMVQHGLVQTVASDAHGVNKRNFYLKEALEGIAHDFGREKVDKMNQFTDRLLHY